MCTPWHVTSQDHGLPNRVYDGIRCACWEYPALDSGWTLTRTRTSQRTLTCVQNPWHNTSDMEAFDKTLTRILRPFTGRLLTRLSPVCKDLSQGGFYKTFTCVQGPWSKTCHRGLFSWLLSKLLTWVARIQTECYRVCGKTKLDFGAVKKRPLKHYTYITFPQYLQCE